MTSRDMVRASLNSAAVQAAAQPAAALPAEEVCRQARLSRDPRFDGRFFIAVVTTGIYCRTTCPARMPAEANVRYFASAPAAQDAGFRPCKRCRPEAALRLPEWTLGSDTVLRALRLIEAGYLNDHAAAELAAMLDVGERQLNRLFAQEIGSTPKSVAQLCRARLASRLLQNTHMKIAEVALHAGYGSVSRFNHEIRQVFHCVPSALRAKKRVTSSLAVDFRLAIRLPYDFDWVFMYLQRRALTGIERVEGGPGAWSFERLVTRDAEGEVWLRVRQSGDELVATLPITDHEPLHHLLTRVRRVFDLNADGHTLHETLQQDSRLGTWVRQAPGLRVPGAWDGFELAVRAVLGQQVSVARGTELANKMVARYGAGLFPTPVQLVDKEVAELGMPGRRGRAISRMAQLVDAGQLVVDECQDYEMFAEQLTSIEGIGPWTANYIRMRALKDPDAFPDNDWVVLKELQCTAAQARRASASWQPWRAYALMYLWYAVGQKRQAAVAMKTRKKQTS
jgi:AraC family transcriptional regulator of adaptative response / DNA-3-methyladenine glycosylase II